MTNPKMMNSGRPRIKDDDYKTIDPRCVLGLLEHWNERLGGLIIDPCSPSGSGIVDFLHLSGKDAIGHDDAFKKYKCDWIVTNPPYKRPLVDEIVQTQLTYLRQGHIRGGICMLLRSGFDHAKTRQKFFRHCNLYYGQIKLMFRPRWFTDGNKTPFHNFVWHIWVREIQTDLPYIMYSDGLGG